MLKPIIKGIVQADSGANASVFNNKSYFIQFHQTKQTLQAFQGVKCLTEGIGLVIIRIPNTDMVIPIFPSYYCSTAPHNIIGLSAIKHHT